MARGGGGVDAYVLGVVLTGILILLAVFVLSNAASLAPVAGKPFYRGGKAFKKGLLAAFFLLVVGTPPAYLFLFRGR